MIFSFVTWENRSRLLAKKKRENTIFHNFGVIFMAIHFNIVWKWLVICTNEFLFDSTTFNPKTVGQLFKKKSLKFLVSNHMASDTMRLSYVFDPTCHFYRKSRAIFTFNIHQWKIAGHYSTLTYCCHLNIENILSNWRISLFFQSFKNHPYLYKIFKKLPTWSDELETIVTCQHSYVMQILN